MNTNGPYIGIYADFLKKHARVKRPLKVVCDCSDGTAGIVLKALHGIENLEMILINDVPDPDFPSHGPNPLVTGALDELSRRVTQEKADIGVAFDADGDRAFFVDDAGTVLSSFQISVLLFRNAKPPYVADETVYKSLEHMAIFPKEAVLPSKVGSYFVKEVLKRSGASVGAEFSGHYYFKDFFGADSGVFAMISVLDILSSMEIPLSVYLASLPKQIVTGENVDMGEKKWHDVEKAIRSYGEKKGLRVETREGLTLDSGDVWINMRASNTEPLLRFIGGGTNAADIAALIADCKKASL